ncbi:cytochrome P450 [Micrococcoides hystricis]|uniref:Cytochrome P450 n=1 Tax=Micrococcoides hystricis TaxID=1572761 RepID=A0ABV6PBX6_9MICC
MTSSTTAPAPAPPVADWVTIEDLYRNPYPIFQRMREQGPIHWVPAVNRYLVIGFDEIDRIDHDADTFTANEEQSLQKKAMGHSMLRKDDPEHAYERKPFTPALGPRGVKKHWAAIFEKNLEHFLSEFEAKAVREGDSFRGDIHKDFGSPYAAQNLVDVLGFENASWQDLARWSQDMIDATGNYADDPEVWARGKKAYDEVDAAIEELIPKLTEEPNHSLLSGLLQYGMPIESIRANLKMSIGGGYNEPRDAFGTTVWALLERPHEYAKVASGEYDWRDAFDESVRWVAPIGMYSRQTTREVEIGGVTLPAKAKLGLCVGAANRDPAHFENPEEFQIGPKRQHLAFGTGVHACAGVWVARSQLADLAFPEVFRRFKNLRLDPERPATAGGWVFRGMLSLPVIWDAE